MLTFWINKLKLHFKYATGFYLGIPADDFLAFDVRLLRGGAPAMDALDLEGILSLVIRAGPIDCRPAAALTFRADEFIAPKVVLLLMVTR